MCDVRDFRSEKCFAASRMCAAGDGKWREGEMCTNTSEKATSFSQLSKIHFESLPRRCQFISLQNHGQRWAEPTHLNFLSVRNCIEMQLDSQIYLSRVQHKTSHTDDDSNIHRKDSLPDSGIDKKLVKLFSCEIFYFHFLSCVPHFEISLCSSVNRDNRRLRNPVFRFFLRTAMNSSRRVALAGTN
jgi:hypothetical protein